MVRQGQLWTSTLCLLTISGLLAAEAVNLPKGFKVEQLRPTQKAYLIPMEITNRKFTSALDNPESQEFRDMYKEVSALLHGVYNCGNSRCPTSSFFGGVHGMLFSPGSVIANAIVVFNTQSINQMIVGSLFRRNAQNAAGNLELNMAYSTKEGVRSAGQ